MHIINPMHYLRRAQARAHLAKVFARLDFERRCNIVSGG